MNKIRNKPYHCPIPMNPTVSRQYLLYSAASRVQIQFKQPICSMKSPHAIGHKRDTLYSASYGVLDWRY